MPNFRRWFRPGGSFFFTVVTHRRRPILTRPVALAILRQVFRAVRARWPVRHDAHVILPDHLHFMWTLPVEDAAYSKRIAWIKKEFTKAWLAAGEPESPQSPGRTRDGRRGVWQSKFWEHTLRDEIDYERHVEYIHYNPVRHGLVSAPRYWPRSSFHRYVRLGLHDADWGAAIEPPLARGLERTTGE